MSDDVSSKKGNGSTEIPKETFDVCLFLREKHDHTDWISGDGPKLGRLFTDTTTRPAQRAQTAGSMTFILRPHYYRSLARDDIPTYMASLLLHSGNPSYRPTRPIRSNDFTHILVA